MARIPTGSEAADGFKVGASGGIVGKRNVKIGVACTGKCYLPWCGLVPFYALTASMPLNNS